MLEEIAGRWQPNSEAVEAAAPDSSIPALLTLLGTGAAGPILMALGRGPLRTRALTERVCRCAPRTVYRHVGKLAEAGLVVRHDEGGVPSVVSYSLSQPSGRELVRLLRSDAVRAFVRGAGEPADGGRLDISGAAGRDVGIGLDRRAGGRTARRPPS